MLTPELEAYAYEVAQAILEAEKKPTQPNLQVASKQPTPTCIPLESIAQAFNKNKPKKG